MHQTRHCNISSRDNCRKAVARPENGRQLTDSICMSTQLYGQVVRRQPCGKQSPWHAVERNCAETGQKYTCSYAVRCMYGYNVAFLDGLSSEDMGPLDFWPTRIHQRASKARGRMMTGHRVATASARTCKWVRVDVVFGNGHW